MSTHKIILAILMLVSTTTMAQKFLTRNGSIRFFSDAPVEKIEALNKQVNAVLDAETGNFEFKVLMKSFIFEKALMQEHFNENYIESDKFPNATFLGKVVNIKTLDAGKNGSYPVDIEGKLTIHGVTNDIKVKGTLNVKDGKVHGTSVFSILLTDYNIRIPNTVVNNISNTIEISIEVELAKLPQ